MFETFTWAEMPYVHVPNENLCEMLVSGFRLSSPFAPMEVPREQRQKCDDIACKHQHCQYARNDSVDGMVQCDTDNVQCHAFVYEQLMVPCWHPASSQRPTFAALVERITEYMDDNDIKPSVHAQQRGLPRADTAGDGSTVAPWLSPSVHLNLSVQDKNCEKVKYVNVDGYTNAGVYSESAYLCEPM